MAIVASAWKITGTRFNRPLGGAPTDSNNQINRPLGGAPTGSNNQINRPPGGAPTGICRSPPSGRYVQRMELRAAPERCRSM